MNCIFRDSKWRLLEVNFLCFLVFQAKQRVSMDFLFFPFFHHLADGKVVEVKVTVTADPNYATVFVSSNKVQGM